MHGAAPVARTIVSPPSGCVASDLVREMTRRFIGSQPLQREPLHRAVASRRFARDLPQQWQDEDPIDFLNDSETESRL